MDPGILGLDGKIALGTGAGRNIGKGCATMLAKAGCHVCVVDIDPEAGRQAMKEIAAMGRNAHFIQADVRDIDQIEAMVRETVRALGGLDVAVNNVGGWGPYSQTPFLEASRQYFADVVAFNFQSTFFCVQAQARSMVERKVKGSIINVASAGGLRARYGSSPYGASKGAVINLTMQAAFELGRLGVRVNCIAPALVPKDTMRTRVSDGSLQPVVDGNPLRRLPSAEEVGGVALFLASDLSSYVTGHTIPVDGGDTITSALGGVTSTGAKFMGMMGR